MDYKRKIDIAISILRSIPQDCTIELSYSGGKDSDVILELAKMSGIPFEAIYKQTTIDPPGTTQHVKSVGARIVRPEMTFFKLIEKKGLPTRFKRFCCGYLKEYKIHDRAIQGIRKCESFKRMRMYNEPEVCRVYNRREKVRVYLPILEWSDEDVERFINERGIKCAPVYYDNDGNFDVKRRLGCIGCPMSRSGRISEFLQYPKMLKLWIRALRVFRMSHRSDLFRDEYDEVFNDIFCKSIKEYENRLVIPVYPIGVESTGEWLERYFGIDSHHIPRFPDGEHFLDTKLFLEDFFKVNLD